MLFRRVLSLLLLVLILFADSGQTIYAHTCLKSNNTSFSLLSPAHCPVKKEVVKSCCAKRQTLSAETCRLGKASCCSVTSKFVKQAFPGRFIELKAVKQFASAAGIATYNFCFTAQQAIASPIYSTPPYPAPSSPFTGVFRI